MDLGELMFSLCYLPTAGRLTITMIKARNLKAMDITGASGGCWLTMFPLRGCVLRYSHKVFNRFIIVCQYLFNGFSYQGNLAILMELATCYFSADPYVKVSLMCEGRRLKKRKTSTKRNTLNPVYNEAIVFDVPPENIDQISLLIAVMDYDRLVSNLCIVPFLGGATTTLDRCNSNKIMIIRLSTHLFSMICCYPAQVHVLCRLKDFAHQIHIFILNIFKTNTSCITCWVNLVYTQDRKLSSIQFLQQISFSVYFCICQKP